MQQMQIPSERERLREIVERANWVYAGLWQLSRDKRSVVWEEGYYYGPPLQGVEVLVPSYVPSKQRSSRRRVLEDLQTGSTDLISMSNLSSTEWFYLASSSFSFPLGSSGTPAKMLTTGGFQWVCDAGEADAHTFSRSDLAKAAGMKTVLCLAVHGGVVELGTTNCIGENLQFVQFIRDVFERGKRTVSSLKTRPDNNWFLNYGTSSFISPISRPSSPGWYGTSTANLQNAPMPITCSNQDMAIFPNGSKNFGDRPPQNTSVSHGNHVGEAFGPEILTVPPSLKNGLIRRHVMESVQLQQNLNDDMQVQQQLSAEAWNASFEQEQQMHVFQAQSNTMLPANLKHKLPSAFGGRIISANLIGGSCMASLEQALFHPRGQHPPCNKGDSSPLEVTGKLLTDFQTHRFRHESLLGHHLGDSQPVVLQHDNNLVQNLSCAETEVGSILSPQGLVDPRKTPDVCWGGIRQGIDNISSPQRLHLRVGSGDALATEELAAVNGYSTNLTSPSRESCHPRGQNTYDLSGSGFLPTPIGSGHRSQFLAEHHSEDYGWSRGRTPIISNEFELEPDSFSRWEDHDKMKNWSFWECCSTRSNKRARELHEETQTSHQKEDEKNGAVKNLISHKLAEKNRLEEKYQVLRAMVKKNYPKADRASVIADIIKLVEELQQSVKETTTSFASGDGHILNPFDTSSSVTSTLVGGNQVNYREEYNLGTVQHPCGRGRVDNEGCHNLLLKLSDVCQENEEELNGAVLCVVDDIPQIEVRMMENEQVMIKLSSKDRPGLFTDIMIALQDLQLDVMFATIRTVSGVVHDVFAAKVNASLLEKQTTSDIAEAMRRAIEKGSMPSSLDHSPQVLDDDAYINSPHEGSS